MTTIFSMEPLLPEDHDRALEEIATELVDCASRLAGRVYPVLQTGLGDLASSMSGRAIWSVARGLARRQQDYKKALQAADEPRRGDLDGRGNLTLSGLEAFSSFSCRPALTRSPSWRACSIHWSC